MAEKTNKDKIVLEGEESKKRSRGRPKKQGPIPYTESITELRMAEKEQGKRVTIQQIEQDLQGLYSKVYNFSNVRNAGGGPWSALSSLNDANPFLQNQRLKRISSQPIAMTREQIAQALENPQNNEAVLRAGGWSLSVTQHLYYRILRLACDVPMYNYYKIPGYMEDEKEYKKDKFIKEDEFVDNWIEKFSPKNTFKRVALETKREGKSTYLLRNSISVNEKGEKIVNFATLQKVPAEFVKLTAIGEYGYIASFDMMLFMNPAFNLSQYPEFIRRIWDDMVGAQVIRQTTLGETIVDVNSLLQFQYRDENEKLQNGIFESREGRYLFWVQLPQKLCYTFASDMSHPWAVPDTIGLFQNLQDLADYNTLAGLVQSTPLTAILTGEAETVSDPNPGMDQTVMNPQTIMGFQNDFNSRTSTNVEALFLPFKNLKLQSLPNIPNSSDIVTKAVQNFTTMSGEGGVIVATEKPSVTMIKGAQKLEEAQQDYVTRQFERVINMIINELIGCEYSWRFFLWGGIFTFEDEMRAMKEMWQNGATFLLPRIASGYDYTIRDLSSAARYVDSLKVYDNFKTLTQEKQKDSVSSNQKGLVGRPTKADGEIDNDNTAASKEGGADISDIKREYSLAEGAVCALCGSHVEEGSFLCEACKEIYKEQIDEEE